MKQYSKLENTNTSRLTPFDKSNLYLPFHQTVQFESVYAAKHVKKLASQHLHVRGIDEWVILKLNPIFISNQIN
jgi:hypothetical protein